MMLGTSELFLGQEYGDAVETPILLSYIQSIALEQRFLTFLMLRPFSRIPPALVMPNHTLFH